MATLGNERRILLVDDYPDALEMWALYLQSMGYVVQTAADGIAAVNMALQFRPHVIVMDLELPGITGYEAAQRLRRDERTRDVPMIAATGFSHTKQLHAAREAGFDAIVIKPCQPDELVSEVERLYSQARSYRSWTENSSELADQYTQNDPAQDLHSN